uniref:Uncharacterized protein n=1 Tax=Meloidogyne enterolobii TaxID=390850 RepID=A0A6V7WER1_MELEN|nr:unnamed protein product [Meloidogyne enterolobii]
MAGNLDQSLQSRSVASQLRSFVRHEDEIALEASNSTATPHSSLFAPLTIPNFKQANPDTPIFHSTPQQHSGKMQRPGLLKSNNNPRTPGGSAISPIAEEGRDDLDKLVSDVIRLRGDEGDKIVQNLVAQLRNMIAKWDVAQAQHRQVAKIYFGRQQDDLNAQWEKLNSERAKFQQEKSDEWAKIAGIRSSLQRNKDIAMAKKDSETIKHLELQLEKLRTKDLLSSQKLSELRIKIKELEGEVNVREKSFKENIVKINNYRDQLARTQQENSNLRTKLTLMKAEKEKQQSEASAQQTLQRTNQSGPRNTLMNVFRANQLSNRMDTSLHNSSSFCSSSSAIRRNNSFSFGNAQHQQQSNILRNNQSFTNGGQNMQSAPRVHFADDPINLFPASSNRSMSSTTSEEISLNKRFELPSEMIYTAYQMTERGKEHTFSDGNNQIIVVELSGCDQPLYCRYCLLYEYSSKLTGENENNSDNANSIDFRWISVSTLPIFNSNENKHKIEINFLQKNNFYQIITPIGNIVKYFLSGQLEVYWKCGDKTIVRPDGERHEFFNPEKPDYYMEIYLPNGTAFRLKASTQWEREEFVPDTAVMSFRSDRSYSALYNQQPHEGSSLQIYAPDFKLRRFDETKAVKIAIPEVSSFNGASLHVWFCVDKVVMVKHIRNANLNNSENSIRERKKYDQYVCLFRGKCEHIRAPPTNG